MVSPGSQSTGTPVVLVPLVPSVVLVPVPGPVLVPSGVVSYENR